MNHCAVNNSRVNRSLVTRLDHKTRARASVEFEPVTFDSGSDAVFHCGGLPEDGKSFIKCLLCFTSPTSFMSHFPHFWHNKNFPENNWLRHFHVFNHSHKKWKDSLETWAVYFYAILKFNRTAQNTWDHC